MAQQQESWRVVLFTDFTADAVVLAQQILAAAGHKLVGVVTSPGVRGRGRGTHVDIVAAAPRGADVLVSNHPERWAAMLAPLQPDLIISASFPWIIPDDVIALPRLGAINLHGGLLPERRGPNSFGWAFRENDPEIGFTIHWLDSSLDTGPILAQVREPIGDDYLDELLPRVFAKVPGLLMEALAKVAAGDPGTPQDESRAFYANIFDEEYRAIDWSRSAREIHNQCRAWMGGGRGMIPGAVGTVDGQALRILRTRVTDGNPTADAGSVLTRDGVTISLDSVDAGLMQTDLVFTVTLPDEAVESHVPDVLGPIFPGNQLKLDGIAVQASGLNLRMKPHQAGDRALTMTMTLGAVTDPARGATVSFTELPFGLDEGGPVVVSGPWEFPLESGLFADVAAASSVTIGKSAASDGLTIAVDRIISSDDGLFVVFSIASDRTGQTDDSTNTVQLVFEDGSTIAATQTDLLDGGPGRIEPDATFTYVATFPPLKESGLAAQISFGPFVSGVPETASIVINDPFGDWSSEPLTLHGERLAVSQVTVDEVTGDLTAVVENIEPVETATRIFGWPTGQLMTATDANGNVSMAVMGATGLQGTKGEAIGAGEHGATFSGIDPTTPTLTLSTSQTAEYLDGPWVIDVQLP